MLKYNYLYHLDPTKMRTSITTVAYDEHGNYAFAIKSHKDKFSKKIGRELARKNYEEGKVLKAGSSVWKNIFDHFEVYRNLYRNYYDQSMYKLPHFLYLSWCIDRHEYYNVFGSSI